VIRVHWRPLIPGEHDPERLWGLVLAGTALFGVGWLFSGMPTPLCPFHAITGLPCPSCGMTRGIRCLLHGNFAAAFFFNPLGMTALMGIAVYVIYAGVVVLGKQPRLRWEPISKRMALLIRTSLFFLVALNWIYLILREKALFSSP